MNALFYTVKSPLLLTNKQTQAERTPYLHFVQSGRLSQSQNI